MDENGVDSEIARAAEKLSNLEINEKPDDEKALKAKFNELCLSGKEKARQGLLEEALADFQEAYKIHESAKLLRRIEKLKEFIKEYEKQEENEGDEAEEEEGEDDDGRDDIGDGFLLARELSTALYPYQKEGLLWFWKLYNRNQGGILGDDMGLGKTIQVIAFLAGMFDSELIKSALIVMPVSLITNWEKEFKKWAPGIRVYPYHGSNKRERLKNLEKIQRKNGVCLTTYGLVVSSHEALSQTSTGKDYQWDYIILDEGHKIKNVTKTSKNVRAIPAKHHFILTGTPIQNNLREMWALFDFTCQGQLLGSSKTFKQEYESPITRARERDASAYEKRIGGEMAESLRKLIQPHFLRRTKAMVLKNTKKEEEGTIKEREEQIDGSQSIPKMPSAKAPEGLKRKNDLIIWLQMSDTQLKIYSDFLGLERVKEMLMSTRSPLAELNVLKKICDHPRLLSAMACTQLGLNERDRAIIDEEDKENHLEVDLSDGSSGPSDQTLIQESGKMVFLVELLDNLREQGHRCLIFSQSRKMLDIIQRVITHRGHKVLRIDGTITSTSERQHLINTFQKNSSYTCFLLTTQVGGVGITLTAADRVVIFDPSWNPATDAQAVDRAYRIGQKKCVVIYRLITCGSIEEKIYRKQIFKDALMKQATGTSKNPFRYFSRQDLRDLFTLDDPTKSKTQQQLAKLHAKQRRSDEQLDRHIDYLHTLDRVIGLTDHDLMYSQEAVETPEELAEAPPHDAIQARVLRAQNMVAAESGQQNHNPVMQPAPYENPKFPMHVRQPNPGREKPDVNILMEKFNSRNPIQSKMPQHFEVFKPSRTDTKRFVPGAVKPKNPRQAPAKSDDVIDLCTPPSTPGEQKSPREQMQSTGADVSDVIDLSDQVAMETSMKDLSINSMGSALETESVPPSDMALSNDSYIEESSPIDRSADTPTFDDSAIQDVTRPSSSDYNSFEPLTKTSVVEDLAESSKDASILDQNADTSAVKEPCMNNTSSKHALEASASEVSLGSIESSDLNLPLANSTFLPTFELNIEGKDGLTEILETTDYDNTSADGYNDRPEAGDVSSTDDASQPIPLFDDRLFQAIDVPGNSPARSPRRKSLRHKRRSISQRPCPDIVDDSDDESETTSRPSSRQQSMSETESVHEECLDTLGSSTHSTGLEGRSVVYGTSPPANFLDTQAQENADGASEVVTSFADEDCKSTDQTGSKIVTSFAGEGCKSIGQTSPVVVEHVSLSSLGAEDDEMSLTRKPRRRVARIESSDEETDSEHRREEEEVSAECEEQSPSNSGDESDVSRGDEGSGSNNVDEVIDASHDIGDPGDDDDDIDDGDDIEGDDDDDIDDGDDIEGYDDDDINDGDDIEGDDDDDIDDGDDIEGGDDDHISGEDIGGDDDDDDDVIDGEDEDDIVTGDDTADNDETGDDDDVDTATLPVRRVRRLDSSDSDATNPSEERDRHNISPVADQIVTLSSSGEHCCSEAVVKASSPGQASEKQAKCPTGLHSSHVVTISKCTCMLNERQKDEYNRQYRLAEQYEARGDETPALEHYFQALEIDEGDLHLHKKVLTLSRDKGLLQCD